MGPSVTTPLRPQGGGGGSLLRTSVRATLAWHRPPNGSLWVRVQRPSHLDLSGVRYDNSDWEDALFCYGFHNLHLLD